MKMKNTITKSIFPKIILSPKQDKQQTFQRYLIFIYEYRQKDIQDIHSGKSELKCINFVEK